MQELHKLHGAAINRKHNDDLFADQENRHPVDASFLKTLSALPISLSEDYDRDLLDMDAGSARNLLDHIMRDY